MGGVCDAASSVVAADVEAVTSARCSGRETDTPVGVVGRIVSVALMMSCGTSEVDFSEVNPSIEVASSFAKG